MLSDAGVIIAAMTAGCALVQHTIHFTFSRRLKLHCTSTCCGFVGQQVVRRAEKLVRKTVVLGF